MPRKLEKPLEPWTTISTLDVTGSTPARSKISTIDDPSSLRDVSNSPVTVSRVSLSPSTSMSLMSPRAVSATASLIDISWLPPTASENSVNTIPVIATIISR